VRSGGWRWPRAGNAGGREAGPRPPRSRSRSLPLPRTCCTSSSPRLAAPLVAAPATRRPSSLAFTHLDLVLPLTPPPPAQPRFHARPAPLSHTMVRLCPLHSLIGVSRSPSLPSRAHRPSSTSSCSTRQSRRLSRSARPPSAATSCTAPSSTTRASSPGVRPSSSRSRSPHRERAPCKRSSVAVDAHSSALTLSLPRAQTASARATRTRPSRASTLSRAPSACRASVRPLSSLPAARPSYTPVADDLTLLSPARSHAHRQAARARPGRRQEPRHPGLGPQADDRRPPGRLRRLPRPRHARLGASCSLSLPPRRRDARA